MSPSPTWWWEEAFANLQEYFVAGWCYGDGARVSSCLFRGLREPQVGIQSFISISLS